MYQYIIRVNHKCYKQILLPNYQWLNKSVWLTASCFKDYLTKTKKKQEKSPRGLLSKNYTTILRLRNPPITQGGISQNKLFLSYGRMPLLHVIIIEGLPYKRQCDHLWESPIKDHRHRTRPRASSPPSVPASQLIYLAFSSFLS